METRITKNEIEVRGFDAEGNLIETRATDEGYYAMSQFGYMTHYNGKPPTKAPVKAPPQATPPKVAQSKNPAVNFYTKRVAIMEQEYKKSVAQDGKMTVSNQTAQAQAELKAARENLQKELRTPLK